MKYYAGFGFFIVIAAFLSPKDATAFCRSTTCPIDCSIDENGCKKSGIPLSWSSSCVGVSMQKDGVLNLSKDEVNQALIRALETWAHVHCPQGGNATFELVKLQDVTCDQVEFNPVGPNANAVIFRTNGWSHLGPENQLDFATVKFDVTTGHIWGADIEINTTDNKFVFADKLQPDETDLQSVLTHALGHLAGLAHSSQPNAVMYPYYALGSIKRTLSDDDIQAVCNAYPPNRVATCDPTPHGGLADQCQTPNKIPPCGCSLDPLSPSASMVWGASALLLACMAWVRRRRQAV